jgi:hypothetical protein
MKTLKVLIPVVVYEEHLISVPEETTPEQAWNLVVEGNYGSEISRVGMSSDKDATVLEDFQSWMVSKE